MDQTQKFHQFLAEDWEFRMQSDPLFATSTGDNRYNDRLPAISEGYYENILSILRGLEIRLKQFDGSTMPPAERLNIDIYSRLLANEIGLLRFFAYRMPVSKAGGFHIYFPELYLQMPMAGEQDHENYISRLAGFKDMSRDILRSCGQASARARWCRASPSRVWQSPSNRISWQIQQTACSASPSEGSPVRCPRLPPGG